MIARRRLTSYCLLSPCTSQAQADASSHTSLRRSRTVLVIALCVMCAVCATDLTACGNTLQDQPIPHNELESLELAPFPVYWLGKQFAGYQITEAGRDPGGAFMVQYGDCLQGGQSTCVAPVEIVTSPDNSFIPGEGSGAVHRAMTLRGLPGYFAEQGTAISLATGPVVLSVFAHTAALAHAAVQTAVPINFPGFPDSPLPERLPNTGYNSRPLPSQIPNQLRPLG
jgi:hypothetical protein